MELDSSKVEKKIVELRETKSCSQSTLMGLCEDTEYSQEDLSKIASGFSEGSLEVTGASNRIIRRR